MWRKNRLQCWLLISVLWIDLHIVSEGPGLPPVASAQTPHRFAILSDDYGNWADEESKLFFVDFNETAEFDTRSDTMLNQGMLPFFQMARQISRSTFAAGYPYDFVTSIAREMHKLAGGGVTPLMAVRAVIMQTPGRFKLSLALGVIIFIFFVVLFLVMPCFLCCSARCRRRKKDLPSVFRVILAGMLVVAFLILALAGLIGAFITVKRTTGTVERLFDGLISGPKDVRTFVDHSANELLFIFVKAALTKRVFFRDLDYIGQLMGELVKTELLNSTGLGEAMQDMTEIEEVTQDSNQVLEALELKLDQLESNVSALSNVLFNASQTAACSAVNCTGSPTLTFNKPNLDQALTLLRGLQSKNLTELASQGIETVNNIPERIERAAGRQVRELKTNLRQQLVNVEKFKGVISNTRDQVLKAMVLGPYEKSVTNMRDNYMEFDSIRSAVMESTLAPGLISLILVLSGTVFLLHVYKKRAKQMREAGRELPGRCGTPVGGYLIYIGAIILVFVAWLLIIFALILFIVGAPVDAVVCATINDPDYQIVDELIEKHDLAGSHTGGTFLAKNVLPIPTSTATIGSILRDCRDAKSLFKAVQMDKHPMANFSRLIMFFDRLQISKTISSISVNVDQASLMSNDVSDYLDNVAGVYDLLPFDDLKQITGNDTVDQQVDEAYDYTNTLPAEIRAQIKNQADEILTDIERLKGDMQDDVTVLEDNLEGINASVQEVKEKAWAAEAAIPVSIKSALEKGASDYEDRVSRIIKGFIYECQRNVFEDYGNCRPLYNIFEEILGNGVCGNVANMLNGGWLALYWFHIMMIAAVFAGIHLNRLFPCRETAAEASSSKVSEQVPAEPPATRTTSDKSEEDQAFQEVCKEDNAKETVRPTPSCPRKCCDKFFNCINCSGRKNKISTQTGTGLVRRKTTGGRRTISHSVQTDHHFSNAV